MEATWTKKHGKSSHGFKLSDCVDHKHKLIRKWVTDKASVHDSQHFDAVLNDWKYQRGSVSGQRGYPTQRLRRGVFTSVPELIQAIERYIDHHNTQPKPFIVDPNFRTVI
ncbi:transposase [Acidithiobacillus thiooxidans]|nr:transposase [Acidithiobacillus albertensis]MBU2793789.1 transposase [Acidithiobacillus thiooxidans]